MVKYPLVPNRVVAFNTPENNEFPVTSKIFPVVVVADAPKINTFDVVVG